MFPVLPAFAGYVPDEFIVDSLFLIQPRLFIPMCHIPFLPHGPTGKLLTVM